MKLLDIEPAPSKKRWLPAALALSTLPVSTEPAVMVSEPWAAAVLAKKIEARGVVSVAPMVPEVMMVPPPAR